MIDPATGWLEIKEILSKRADIVSNVLEKTWLSRYPRPSVIILDRGKELMVEVTCMIKYDYSIKKKPISVRNPQANAIIEQVHQTIANIILMFDINNMEIEYDDPWISTPTAVIFAIRSLVHTKSQYMPSQLIFGRDYMLNILHEANWKLIQARKQRIILQNNTRKNRKRNPYIYNVGNNLIIKGDQSAKYANTAYKGPYTVTARYALTWILSAMCTAFVMCILIENDTGRMEPTEEERRMWKHKIDIKVQTYL